MMGYSTSLADLRAIAQDISPDDWECDVLGLRVVDSDYRGYSYRVGRIVPRSWNWVDGDHTNERLDGTCCISLARIANSVPNAVDDFGGYSGRRIWLLGGGWSSGGEDPGEIIIRDAKILKIIDLD
jgi:hypothetical protein